MGDAGALDGGRLHPARPLALAADEFALFVLNVGDGDAIVLRFPPDRPGNPPSYGIVDAFDGDKVIALIGLLGPGPIRFVCATHPHFDHIRGLRQVLRRFTGTVSEFWDSGFRFTSTTYRRLLDEVVTQSATLRFVRPTSGFEIFHAGAQVTVLSPSIALRNRYDTYGVDVNNASIVLRLGYPSLPPATDFPSAVGEARPAAPKSRSVILGGDAQTDAWGQVMQEFPHLDREPRNWARQIGGGGGAHPLACDLFKVSHHASKRGVNLELLERFGDRSGGIGVSRGPRWLVSSCASGSASGYGFPHTVTHQLLREVRDPQAQAGRPHRPDDQLGIHFTSQLVTGSGDASPAGSVAYVIGADGSSHLYRLGDSATEPVDLSSARRAR